MSLSLNCLPVGRGDLVSNEVENNSLVAALTEVYANLSERYIYPTRNTKIMISTLV